MTIGSSLGRQVYTGNGSTVDFAFNAPVAADTELAIYTVVTATGVQTLQTKGGAGTYDYTVAINASTKFATITLNTALPSTHKIVIIRNVPITQTTDYVAGDPFPAETHEAALDKLTTIATQISEVADRSVKVQESSATSNITMSELVADKVVKVNSAATGLEMGPTTANLDTLAGIASDITTVAGIASNVTTVAGISSNVTTVAGISSNVTTVAGISANVTTVAGNTTNINTCATNIAAINAAPTAATNAAASATAAAASATAAATSETNAGTSETNAATSATNAATSATNAGTSETNAASSASAAATSATNAATSETNAATSATTATTQATNAATSATSAATSATAAQTAQAAAEAAADNFDDTYLGAKASDPTVDNDGDALTAGDLYFNTSTNKIRVYDGSSWNDSIIDISQVVEKSSNTGSAYLPAGTTAQRDGSPSAGYIRFNSTETSFEGYDGSAWGSIGGGASAGGTIYENGDTITSSYTITTGSNAMSVGPMTLNTGVTVTVPSGQRWVIL